jgi:hypothetical protein
VQASLKRKLAIGTVGIAVLAGAGGTYAATRGPGEDRDAYLNDVAKRLGVSRTDLNKALKGAFFDRLDAAVAAGRLTKQQADDIKKHVQENGGMPVPFAGPPPGFKERHFGGPGFGPPGLGGPPGPVVGGLDAAADYLGLTGAQLKNKIENGKSLADIATAEGKSIDGLKKAIEDGVRKELDEAVKDKRLTDKMRDQILAGLDKRIDDIVHNKFGERHWGPKPGFHRDLDTL